MVCFFRFRFAQFYWNGFVKFSRKYLYSVELKTVCTVWRKKKQNDSEKKKCLTTLKTILWCKNGHQEVKTFKNTMAIYCLIIFAYRALDSRFVYSFTSLCSSFFYTSCVFVFLFSLSLFLSVSKTRNCFRRYLSSQFLAYRLFVCSRCVLSF